MSIHIVPDAPEAGPVRVELDGAVLYLDAEGVQLSIEDGEGVGLITLPVPISLLRAARAILTHPQLSALLDAHEATARPPVA